MLQFQAKKQVSYAESDEDEDVVVSRKGTRSRRTASRPVAKDEDEDDYEANNEEPQEEFDDGKSELICPAYGGSLLT